ncbi:MAG: aminodeoxychorismate/anthranilate synthase component II [Limnochordia bacterium]
MIVIIDNGGAFVYNLYQYFGEMDRHTAVIRSDEVVVQELEKIAPSCIVLSSGSGLPEDVGICSQVLAAFTGRIPILGIGFGHLAIARHIGAGIIPAKRIAHGKTTLIHHCGEQVFHGIKAPLKVTCYHSFVVEPKALPEVLQVLAVTTEGEVMAIRHRMHPVFGLQFHPEAIATECGTQILRNFLNLELIGGGNCVA